MNCVEMHGPPRMHGDVPRLAVCVAMQVSQPLASNYKEPKRRRASNLHTCTYMCLMFHSLPFSFRWLVVCFCDTVPLPQSL
eukprot:m.143040 g.143040  ORF g.143040 m.143040 type:complete len:81 (-) comp14077_c0_seq1:82-324(-)